jgi:hypothetical protein
MVIASSIDANSTQNLNSIPAFVPAAGTDLADADFGGGIVKGITLAGTDINGSSIASGYYFWGTASESLSSNTKLSEASDNNNYYVTFASTTTGSLPLYSTSTFYFNPSESREWYWENKSHIEWWMVNNDRDMQIITFESYIQLLKNFAISKPTCTVIVLPAFHSSKYNQDIFNNLPPHNFLRANINLSTVSQIEIDDTTEYDYFKWTKFTKVDSRVNHLTQINLTILANLLVESIKTLNIDNITYNKFQTNIIKTITSKEEYLKYVENNILPYRKDIDQIIS